MDATLRDAHRAWLSSGDLDAAEALLRLCARTDAEDLVPEVLHGLAGAWQVRRDERAARVVIAEAWRLPPERRLRVASIVDGLACDGFAPAVQAYREWFPPLAEIVGGSAGMRRVRAQVAAWARADHPVLVVGDSGVEHDLTARALHELSEREEFHLLYPVDVAVLEHRVVAPPPLGGTLCLDDADPGDDPERGLAWCRERGTRLVVGTRHGADEPWPPDLLAHVIEIPALRDRFEDLPLLVEHLLGQRGRPARPPEAFLAHLRRFGWRDNVRQLDHVLRLLVTLAGRGYLFRPELWEQLPT